MRDDSAHSGDFRRSRRNPRRLNDDEPYFQKRSRHRVAMPSVETFDITDGLPEGDRWSTWDLPAAGERGPQPYPRWLVTELAAVDTELGVLKTGKEADVFLVRRGCRGPARPACSPRSATATPGTGCSTGTATYREGRRVRQSRDKPGHGQGHRGRPADDRRPVGQRRVHGAGAGCTRPASPCRTRSRCSAPSCMQEFIGEADGTAAPRLAETRPDPAELRTCGDQLVEAAVLLAGRAGAWRPVRLQPAGARAAGWS